jgi:hypothetical protein
MTSSSRDSFPVAAADQRPFMSDRLLAAAVPTIRSRGTGVSREESKNYENLER